MKLYSKGELNRLARSVWTDGQASYKDTFFIYE